LCRLLDVGDEGVVLGHALVFDEDGAGGAAAHVGDAGPRGLVVLRSGRADDAAVGHALAVLEAGAGGAGRVAHALAGVLVVGRVGAADVAGREAGAVDFDGAEPALGSAATGAQAGRRHHRGNTEKNRSKL